MDKKILDEMILKKEQQVLIMRSLDYVSMQKEDDLNVSQRMYKEIAEETMKLCDNGNYSYKLSIKYKLKNCKGKAKEFLRMIDFKLQRFFFYKNIVRKKMKKVYYSKKYAVPSVNVFRLIRNDDEKFIIELYHQLLDREPDDKGYKYNLHMLKERKVTRLGLVYTFYNSKENLVPKKLTRTKLARLFDR